MTTTIGSSERRRGVDALSAAEQSGKTDIELLYTLLGRAAAMTKDGQPVRFKFGDETFTARQLQLAVESGDGARAVDLLRAKGVSLPEMVELVDDVVANPARFSGQTIDCQAGTSTAKLYGLGAVGDDTVNLDDDPSRLTRAAAASKPMSGAFDLKTERVSGPNFFEMIGEAILEALAAIGRAFGGKWNPDTETFNGRVDDAHFRDLGAEMARSPQGSVFHLAIGSAEGRDALRAELMNKKPEGATELQWRRAIEQMITGMKGHFDAEEAAGRLPAGLTDADARCALTFLRASHYSEAATADLSLVLAQPPAVRSRLLESLASLPETERGNLLDLLRPSGNGDDLNGAAETAYFVRMDWERASPEAKLAIVETLRRNGFRGAVGDPETLSVTTAATKSDYLSGETKTRYLALLPKLGVSRAYLAGNDLGLERRLDGMAPAEQLRLLDAIEANLGSTSTLVRIIAHASTTVRLAKPNAGVITTAAVKEQILSTFERRNVTLTSGDVTLSADGSNGSVSLRRYFSDAAYRTETLTKLGMTREAFEGFLQNAGESLRTSDRESHSAADTSAIMIEGAWQTLANPDATPDERRRAWSELRSGNLEREIGLGASNVQLDISPGSSADRLFGLRSSDRDSPLYAFGAAMLASDSGPDFTVLVRTKSGGDLRISRAEMAAFFTEPLPAGKTRAQLFAERYKGLDFKDTIAVFAQIDRLAGSSGLRGQPKDDGYQVDLRKKTGVGALDAIRAKMSDGKDGNIARPTFLEAALPLTSTDAGPSLQVASTAEVGAVAGNNWFQFGIFYRGGYSSASAVLAAAKKSPGFAGFGEALFGLDAYSKSHTKLAKGGTALEQGEASGEASRIFPPGTRADEVRVMTFIGRGASAERRAFKASGDSIVAAAKLGEIPAGNMIRHEGVPTPDEMYAEIRTQLTRSPPPKALVIHYAGHTGSSNSDVSGFILTDADGNRVFFSPARMRELNQIAEQQGVNLLWVTDACRGGEYVEQARAETISRLEATGNLPASVASLEKLRSGTIGLFRAYDALAKRPKPPAPYPTDAALATLVRRALKDGPSSAAMTELRTLSTTLSTNEKIPWEDRAILARFVDATEKIHAARAELANEPNLEPNTLDHPFLTGDLAWAPGRTFMVYKLGPLYDRISSELRERMPAMTGGGV